MSRIILEAEWAAHEATEWPSYWANPEVPNVPLNLQLVEHRNSLPDSLPGHTNFPPFLPVSHANPPPGHQKILLQGYHGTLKMLLRVSLITPEPQWHRRSGLHLHVVLLPLPRPLSRGKAAGAPAGEALATEPPVSGKTCSPKSPKQAPGPHIGYPSSCCCRPSASKSTSPCRFHPRFSPSAQPAPLRPHPLQRSCPAPSFRVSPRSASSLPPARLRPALWRRRCAAVGRVTPPPWKALCWTDVAGPKVRKATHLYFWRILVAKSWR